MDGKQLLARRKTPVRSCAPTSGQLELARAILSIPPTEVTAQPHLTQTAAATIAAAEAPPQAADDGVLSQENRAAVQEKEAAAAKAQAAGDELLQQEERAAAKTAAKAAANRAKKLRQKANKQAQQPAQEPQPDDKLPNETNERDDCAACTHEDRTDHDQSTSSTFQLSVHDSQAEPDVPTPSKDTELRPNRMQMIQSTTQASISGTGQTVQSPSTDASTSHTEQSSAVVDDIHNQLAEADPAHKQLHDLMLCPITKVCIYCFVRQHHSWLRHACSCHTLGSNITLVSMLHVAPH